MDSRSRDKTETIVLGVISVVSIVVAIIFEFRRQHGAWLVLSVGSSVLTLWSLAWITWDRLRRRRE